MKFRNILLLLFAPILLASCVEETYFGGSEFANIKKFAVSNQSGAAVINNDSATVVVEIPGGVDLSAVTVQELELSSFTTSELRVGEVINLEKPFVTTLVSENGTPRPWTITAFVASSAPQLSNGNLNEWYKTATGYYEPGQDAATTIWGTGNRGTQLLKKLATFPKDLGNKNLAAQMETLDNGTFGAAFGAPISSGSLFTGFFNPDKINPANPEAAIEFGTPFAGRPAKLQLKYSYVPGAVNKSKAGATLDYGDACDIYALLEVRIGGETKRLATAWFRGKELQKDLTTKEITFTYGELDSSFPDYTKPANKLYVTLAEADFILPTHLTFVASSSFDGAKFAGAVGSKLVVDDIVLLYQ